ncbi:hypothetical protein EV182_000072 [Spiromyces aspiralis]|uniref:Uncharacterized protein n=1 Tax=Spiromyces aspiralis TaxID=68401 RepID=A0ACC1HVT8_9FUNG|nr:hypothetical protein EV182_000072 [Spiromyces aspiralis]
MTLKLPAKGDSKMPSSVVGQIEHSGFKFTVIESRPSPDGDFADGSIPAAQELQSMNILLPNDGEDNGLVFAPCKPTRFFTVTRNVDVPDPTEAAKRILVTPYVPQAHPANMKFRFKPNGFDTGIPIAQQKMEIEEAREEVTTPVKKKAKKSNKSGKTPGSDKKSKKSTKTPIIKSRDSSKHDDD